MRETKKTAGRPWRSRCIEDVYEKEAQIGEGTYGLVCRAHKKADRNEVVALKEIKLEEREGFPITAVREIMLLKQLSHENIINLKEIVTDNSNKSVYMVLDYMDHDLSGLLKAGHVFAPNVIKSYMRQLLKGLHFCHANKVLHRDIKAANLLINNKGMLKIADFGLARDEADNAEYTPRVITRWYRPPELLLGARSYGPEVDMWSVGCIFYELILRKPPFPGNDDTDQLERIFSVCGSPTPGNWPKFLELPHAKNVLIEINGKPRHQITLRQAHESLIDPIALKLLEQMLVLDPSCRISAARALEHDYFWTDPLPLEPSQIPPYDAPCHDYNAKRAAGPKRDMPQHQQTFERQKRARRHEQDP